MRRRVVRACLARHEVNYGRSFFDEGQCVAAASAVEVTGLGFVDQLAQQAASSNADGANDRCHAPLVAALLAPELLNAAKHLSIHATLLTNSRSRRSLPAPGCCRVLLRGAPPSFAAGGLPCFGVRAPPRRGRVRNRAGFRQNYQSGRRHPRAVVFRHERGHCNGWGSDRKGARAIVIPAPSAKVR